ncbi:hypothetical protein LZC95_35905 [Pendulispora brunnea]|uniref:PEGA domain-containing protein n=1 Tax=Pendulispora brunnea TaxID=2905690 RepID=A0ABZ2K4W4_9BACT
MTLPASRSIVRATALLASAAMAFAAFPASVHAQGDARACVAAVEQGQILHRDGKLRKAREKFIACARDECPGPVRRDCAHWLSEVDASLPSVVFGAKLRDGRELRKGRVLFDGEPLHDSLNGRAVAVDPGAHTLRFELEGAKPLQIETVIHEGEKNRLIAPTLEPLDGPATPPAAVTAPEPSAPPPEEPKKTEPAESRPIPVAAFLTGGVALVGLAGFTYFGLKGRGELDDLRSSCGPNCPQDDVDSARSKLLVGDVFLAGGLIAAGITTYLVLTRPTVRNPNVTFDVQASPRGATAELRARF